VRHSLKRSALNVESLESRIVPAGNLVVTVQGSFVQVVGDAADNGIEISVGTGGAIVFRGLDGTRINGRSDQLVFPISGGLSGLSVETGAGADVVVISSRSEADPNWPYPQTIAALDISQDLTVNTGTESDVVLLRDVTVNGNLTVIGGQGDDIIVAEAIQVDGALSAMAGPGVNRVLVRDSSVTGTTTVGAGVNRDVVGLIGSTLGATVLSLRAGPNQVSAETNTFNGDFSLPRIGMGHNRLTEDVAELNTFNGQLLVSGWNQTLHTVATTHFEYEGAEGPDNWGKLTPAFLLTSVGRQQTPVAIDTASVVTTPLPALNFSYVDNTDLEFVHNGHAIQVNFPTPALNTVEVGGGVYELIQFHFHAESEHTIDGESFPLEMHMVHADANGNLLVVTVFITEGAVANPAYDQLVANLPSLTNPSETIPGPFDPETLLPTDRGYYAYSGSLTTPPGSEGVSFGLFKTPVVLSPAQILAIQNAIGLENNRPVQPVNNRVIFGSA